MGQNFCKKPLKPPIDSFVFNNLSDEEFVNFENVSIDTEHSNHFTIKFMHPHNIFTTENLNKLFDSCNKSYQEIPYLFFEFLNPPPFDIFIKNLSEFCNNSKCCEIILLIRNIIDTEQFRIFVNKCYDIFKNLLKYMCISFKSNNNFTNILMNDIREKSRNEQNRTLMYSFIISRYDPYYSYRFILNNPIHYPKNDLIITQRQKVYQTLQEHCEQKSKKIKIIGNGYVFGGKSSLFYLKNMRPYVFEQILQYL